MEKEIHPVFASEALEVVIANKVKQFRLIEHHINFSQEEPEGSLRKRGSR